MLGCGAASNAAFVSQSQSNVNRSEGTQHYRNACVITWEAGEAILEARVETIKLPRARETESLPSARLRIRNLSNGQTIYERDEADSFLTMYREAVNDDVGEALILRWAGGSAERLEILDVDRNQARRIFYESYRVDASLVNVGGNSRVILLTTCDGGAGPCFTNRFVWRGGKYQKAGTIPSERFDAAMERLFGR